MAGPNLRQPAGTYVHTPQQTHPPPFTPNAPSASGEHNATALTAAVQRPSPLLLPLRPGGHQSDLDIPSSNLHQWSSVMPALDKALLSALEDRSSLMASLLHPDPILRTTQGPMPALDLHYAPSQPQQQHTAAAATSSGLGARAWLLGGIRQGLSLYTTSPGLLLFSSSPAWILLHLAQSFVGGCRPLGGNRVLDPDQEDAKDSCCHTVHPSPSSPIVTLTTPGIANGIGHGSGRREKAGRAGVDSCFFRPRAAD